METEIFRDRDRQIDRLAVRETELQTHLQGDRTITDRLT